MAKGMNIRTDDTVVLIAGKDKGKTGRVLRTDPGKRRVYVEGLNMVKRHTRPRSVKDTQKAQSSGIIDQEASDPRLERDARRPHRQQADPGRGPRAENGKRARYSKRTGKVIG